MTDSIGPTPPADGAAPPPEPAPASRRGLVIGLILGLAALGLGVWFVVAELPVLLTRPRNLPPAPAAEATPPPDTRRSHVSLFYVSDSGLELVPYPCDLPYSSTPGELARRIVEAQIKAPPSGQVSAIPPETTLRDVYLTTTGEAYVDLGPEIVAHHTGGTLDEALAVYAIVNALAENVRNVNAVQILIDGKQVDTLAGHIDLRRPLAKSLEWVQNGTSGGNPPKGVQ